MTRRIVAVTLAALAALILAACGSDESSTTTSATTPTGTPVEATIMLDWYINADHMGLVAARDGGHFTKAGADITLTVPSDPASALKQVASGKAEFAISYTSEVLLARAEGVPVVAVGSVISHPLNAIIARADRGITRPRDLEGKVVGATGVPSDAVQLRAAVESDGGDPGKVTRKNIGYSLTPALAAGSVDAIIGAYWNIEVPELEAKGIKVNVIRLDDGSLGIPKHDELVLVTSDAYARDNPEAVRSVLKGLTAGQQWAADNLDESAAMLKKANPDLDAKVLARQVTLTGPLLSRDAAVDPVQWERYADWMRVGKLLTGEGSTKEAVTTEFLK